ncbi:unnamed protein product [Brassica oleracea var. botrytis]
MFVVQVGVNMLPLFGLWFRRTCCSAGVNSGFSPALVYPMMYSSMCNVGCLIQVYFSVKKKLSRRLSIMGSSSDVVSSTIAKKWREHPPSSYSLKVDNFRQLEKFASTSDDKYQSRLFSSGGYNWKLLVYPKGNEKDNGKGFISMYVAIDSKSLTSAPQCEVFAELIFFVYNKKEKKYLTIQDVEVNRFNALKTVWGLQQVLSSDSFNNPESGYVFEGDQCKFGVDVIVPSPLNNWEILSFNEKLRNPKFSWSVKKFSQLKEDKYISNTFSVGARKWVLWLYPKGGSGEDGKWVSLYLQSADSDKPKADEKILAQANLRVLDPLGSNHIEVKLNNWHVEQNLGWGRTRFLSLAELRKVYLDKEDALKVEIEFEVVSSTKYYPII